MLTAFIVNSIKESHQVKFLHSSCLPSVTTLKQHLLIQLWKPQSFHYCRTHFYWGDLSRHIFLLEAVRVAFKVSLELTKRTCRSIRQFPPNHAGHSVRHCQISAQVWSWRPLMHKTLPKGANLLSQKCSTVQEIHEHIIINEKLLFSYLFSCVLATPSSSTQKPFTVFLEPPEGSSKIKRPN